MKAMAKIESKAQVFLFFSKTAGEIGLLKKNDDQIDLYLSLDVISSSRQ